MLWPNSITCHDNAPQLSGMSVEWRAPENRIDTDGYPRIYPWRSCTYCGSIHPGDLVELTTKVKFVDAFTPIEGKLTQPHMEFADFKYGFPHKVYVTSLVVLKPEVEFTAGKRADGTELKKMGHLPFIKFYTEHLLETGIDDEAFAAISKVLHDYAGITFARDENGVKWKRRTDGEEQQRNTNVQ